MVVRPDGGDKSALVRAAGGLLRPPEAPRHGAGGRGPRPRAHPIPIRV